jgi:hypothetical protein
MLAVLMTLAWAQAPASSCGISDEPAFATTRDHAIQVGGGAVYVAARERRYLDALLGPMGEPLTYKRTGAFRPDVDKEGRTILDAYEVTYPGLDKPVTFYLDGYHFDDALKAPKGFTCAVPIGLSAPPPDGLLAAESLLQLAIEQGAVKDFAPISLDVDGSSAHGVLIDHFRVIARASRAASAAGTPIDPKTPSLELMRTRMVVVAYPLRCGDKAPVAPASIDIVPGQGPPPRRDGEIATGEALARLLPGMDLPAGAIAATFLIDRPRATDAIKIAYPDGGCGTSNEALLPMKYTNAKPGDAAAVATGGTDRHRSSGEAPGHHRSRWQRAARFLHRRPRRAHRRGDRDGPRLDGRTRAFERVADRHARDAAGQVRAAPAVNLASRVLHTHPPHWRA